MTVPLERTKYMNISKKCNVIQLKDLTRLNAENCLKSHYFIENVNSNKTRQNKNVAIYAVVII